MFQIRIATVITMLALLAGCYNEADITVIPGAEDAPSFALSEQPFDAQPESSVIEAYVPVPSEPTAPIPAASYGDGTIAYAENIDLLDSYQEQIILDFMNTYYNSLAELTVQGPTELFSPNAKEQADNNRMVWEAMVAIRSMQKTDLTLIGYSFELTVTAITEQDNGDIAVRVMEDFIQNFTAYPGVDSKGFGVSHNFTFTKEGGQWFLSHHRQSDSLSHNVMGRWRFGGSNADMPEISTEQRRDDWIAGAREAVAGRSEQGRQPGQISYDNAYNREDAAGYAREWASKRNPAWQMYDRMGGNCQNFVSQAIFAGGVPMDYVAPAQWKWYGDTPSSAYTASGRAPAWTGVKEFLVYVQNNRGFGMTAFADAPFYSGEPGDVIHMGYNGDLRHTVIITDIMKDDDGNTVDYLIASNTANLLDFPVSAFHYQEQMLIKIYGWNKQTTLPPQKQ